MSKSLLFLFRRLLRIRRGLSCMGRWTLCFKQRASSACVKVKKESLKITYHRKCHAKSTSKTVKVISALTKRIFSTVNVQTRCSKSIHLFPVVRTIVCHREMRDSKWKFMATQLTPGIYTTYGVKDSNSHEWRKLLLISSHKLIFSPFLFRHISKQYH